MTKKELEDFLKDDFDLVLENENKEEIINKNKNLLNLSINDQKCFIKVSNIIAKKNNKILYFIYYDGVDRTLNYTAKNKNFLVLKPDGTKELNKYKFLNYVKDDLPNSNSYVVFYSNYNIIFDEKYGFRNHIIVVNDKTIINCLNNLFR